MRATRDDGEGRWTRRAGGATRGADGGGDASDASDDIEIETARFFLKCRGARRDGSDAFGARATIGGGWTDVYSFDAAQRWRSMTMGTTSTMG